MVLYNEINLDKCIIITINGKEYKKLSDVPECEYLNIHTIKDVNPILFKNHERFNVISKFINLRFISCDLDDWTKSIKEKLINDIACLEKLSIFGMIDYDKFSRGPHNTGSFIWKNNMTIFNPNNADFTNIPNNIEYLNIINDTECDYVNIPYTVKHLHICINKINNYKQTNLPVKLQNITITIPEIYKRCSKNELYSTIKYKTKLPFGCELIIDDIY